MALRVSRRRIAAYAADKLVSGAASSLVLREVAAYLVATGRTREQELLVRDIEAALAARGVVVADVASAFAISESVKAEIAKLVGASTVELRETIDPTLLGGVRVDIPGRRFDGTIRHKLTALRAKQL
jgi:F-type H+-transporting ATPase subunit delta